jgi:hypothetical protein
LFLSARTAISRALLFFSILRANLVLFMVRPPVLVPASEL